MCVKNLQLKSRCDEVDAEEKILRHSRDRFEDTGNSWKKLEPIIVVQKIGSMKTILSQ